MVDQNKCIQTKMPRIYRKMTHLWSFFYIIYTYLVIFLYSLYSFAWIQQGWHGFCFGYKEVVVYKHTIPESKSSIFMLLEYFIPEKFIDAHSTTRIYWKWQGKKIRMRKTLEPLYKMVHYNIVHYKMVHYKMADYSLYDSSLYDSSL